LQENPEQVLHKIPATFQAVPASTPSFDLAANIAGMIEAGAITTIHLGD
jgi:hypothetical protein